MNLAFYQRGFFIENCFNSAHFNHEFLKVDEESKTEKEVNVLPDFATLEAYKFENDRHRVIVAMLISDFFLFIMKHFKNNHIIQFIYISQLVVDANGVLVLLKFLNQEFSKIDFTSEKIDQKF